MQNYEIIIGDQKTDEWQKLREGVLTGSVAKNVLGAGNAYLYETLAMMTTVRDPKQAYGEHIDRGNELEPLAIEAYEKATKQKVRRDIAFIKNGRYGFSPDGAVFRGGVIKKLVESKAPDTNNHIRYILENSKTIPKEHIAQIVHGFIVCDDVDEIDFVSYCPVYKFKPLHIITVRRMDLYVEIETTKVQYGKFIEKLDKSYQALIL